MYCAKVQLLYTVKEKGGKPDRKTYPPPYGLRNPYKNLSSENSQDYAQKPLRNCTFMKSASGHIFTFPAVFRVSLGYCSALYYNKTASIEVT